jgi:hypothetical protein
LQQLPAPDSFLVRLVRFLSELVSCYPSFRSGFHHWGCACSSSAEKGFTIRIQGFTIRIQGFTIWVQGFVFFFGKICLFQSFLVSVTIHSFLANEVKIALNFLSGSQFLAPVLAQ